MDPSFFFMAFIVIIPFYLSRKLYKYLLIKNYDNSVFISVFAFIILLIVIFITTMSLLYAITGVKC